MLSVRFISRGTLLASAIALSSCASSTGYGSPSLVPGSPLSSRPTAGSSVARPDGVIGGTVTVSFHNKATRRLEVTTYSSYPIVPGWTEEATWCVEPDSVRQTSIKFNFDKPDIAIDVHDNNCGGGHPYSARIEFNFVQFLNGENEIDSHATEQGNQLEFCATPQYFQKGKCEKLK